MENDDPVIRVEICSHVLRSLIERQQISVQDLHGMDNASKSQVKQWLLDTLFSEWPDPIRLKPQIFILHPLIKFYTIKTISYLHAAYLGKVY